MILYYHLVYRRVQIIMKFWTDFRIKFRNFFKKHKNKIYIALIIFVVVNIVNQYLGRIEEVHERITTYEPHISVMNDSSSVPKKLQTPIEKTIDDFVTYCNNKDYESAYNLLSSGCKSDGYPTIDDFKTYVNLKFPNKKLYAIQDYSNLNGKYIYQVKIFDDILASGLTGTQYSYYDERIAI